MKENLFNKIFKYNEQEEYEFILSDAQNNLDEEAFEKEDKQTVYSSLEENLNYLKIKYNMLINNDIKIRKFNLNIYNKKIPAFLFFIDGMIDNDSINNFILQPLLLKNSIKMNENKKATNQILDNEKQKFVKFNLENFLYSSLIPQNSVEKVGEFKEVTSMVNAGFCALFVESLNVALCIETKGFEGRSVSNPITEAVVKGAHEGFVENIRTNTSLIRKIINNENLVIEETSVGKISKTQVAICYIKNIANDDLVAEVKYRVNNLDIDYLLSTGQLSQIIKDNPTTPFPQAISTERPDRTSSYLLLGRIAILVNGSPFALIVPAILIDFLTSPEDYNLNYHYANFLRGLRSIALLFALFLPGLYIAITMYHQELIPSELLFTIISAREAIPFPIFFEIIIMEVSFELIQEASIRVPATFSTTVRNNWSTYFRRCSGFS